jgi:ABC-type multidrug transport system ATPase subunit
MTDPIVRVENLVVRRGGRVILDGISVEVGAGDVVAIVGANGTGKSTLLACVAGVLPPRAGRVTIQDESVWGARGAIAKRALGYCPEAADPPPYLTGAELWALVAAARGVDGPSAELRATFGLDQVAGVRLDRMSLGMRRRACLAAAWLGPPAVLVLDEPDNGLDAARLDALVTMIAAHAAAGRAALVATHDPDVIDRIGARRFAVG